MTIRFNLNVKGNKLALQNYLSKDATEEEVYFTLGVLDKIKHDLMCLFGDDEDE